MDAGLGCDDAGISLRSGRTLSNDDSPHVLRTSYARTALPLVTAKRCRALRFPRSESLLELS
jgi:hypothetical protein